jgi:hypothetical protein
MIPGKDDLPNIELRISIIWDFSKEFHRMPSALGSQAQTMETHVVCSISVISNCRMQ